MRCNTIKINFDNEQGFIIINEDDFNEEIHTNFDESDQNSKAAKEGTKAWYIEKLTEAGIEFDENAKVKDLKALLEAD
jgi:hypothetical protein